MLRGLWLVCLSIGVAGAAVVAIIFGGIVADHVIADLGRRVHCKQIAREGIVREYCRR